jgi:cell division protein FtsB
VSKEELHSIAEADSPNQVSIPQTWQALVVWAIARFGVGLVVAAVFGYATTIVYQDLKTSRDQLMEAYKDNTRIMETFNRQLDEMERTIDEAHRRALNP